MLAKIYLGMSESQGPLESLCVPEKEQGFDYESLHTFCSPQADLTARSPERASF